MVTDLIEQQNFKSEKYMVGNAGSWCLTNGNSEHPGVEDVSPTSAMSVGGPLASGGSHAKRASVGPAVGLVSNI